MCPEMWASSRVLRRCFYEKYWSILSGVFKILGTIKFQIEGEHGYNCWYYYSRNWFFFIVIVVSSSSVSINSSFYKIERNLNFLRLIIFSDARGSCCERKNRRWEVIRAVSARALKSKSIPNWEFHFTKFHCYPPTRIIYYNALANLNELPVKFESEL